MRGLLRILAIVVLIISVAWLYSEPSYKSLLAAAGALSGLIALIATFLFRKKDRHGSYSGKRTATVPVRSKQLETILPPYKQAGM